MKGLKRFWADQEGASAVEYGLIAVLVAIAIVGILYLIGPKLSGTFGASTNDAQPATTQ